MQIFKSIAIVCNTIGTTPINNELIKLILIYIIGNNDPQLCNYFREWEVEFPEPSPIPEPPYFK